MTKTRKVLGIIGCGNISDIYLKNLTGPFADHVRVGAVADLLPDKAKRAAAQYGIPDVCTPEEMLRRTDIDVVLNLTVPFAHYEVCQKALQAGKHVYVEKPLSVERDEGRRLLDLAEKKGVVVGCAPDTVLGAGTQTCRRLLDNGAIGRPVAGVAFMAGAGHESWHPDPGFYYKKGGGPLFDMGPYYLSSLITLLGPVRSVVGSTQMSFAKRTIGSAPKKGQVIEVEVPTHISAILEFAQGVSVTMMMSFDVPRHNLPRIEIYGSEGSLMVPDPNGFGGEVSLFQRGDDEVKAVSLDPGYSENSRGLGVADMVRAIAEGKGHRASGQLAFHVLDIMHAVHESSDEGRRVELSSTVERPEAMAPR